MVKNFTIADWKIQVNEPSSGQALMIEFAEHGIENPIFQVFEHQGDGIYSNVLGVLTVSEAHDIMLISNKPYDGKIVIK